MHMRNGGRWPVLPILVCILTGLSCATPAASGELFGDEPGQPAPREAAPAHSGMTMQETINALGTLGLSLGLSLAPMASPFSQLATAAAGAGSHGHGHGQGHGE